LQSQLIATFCDLGGRREFLLQNAVAGVYNRSVTPYDDTKTYDIVRYSLRRVLSIFGDIDFQSKAGTNIGGALLQLKLRI
jgi:hypothetical protein